MSLWNTTKPISHPKLLHAPTKVHSYRFNSVDDFVVAIKKEQKRETERRVGMEREREKERKRERASV